MRAQAADNVDADPWVALTIDVKAAHKRMKLQEKDGGLSFFHFMGVLWRFIVCHFGAAWSAYWCARVGAALHRLLHRMLWTGYLAWVYVDDTLVLVRRSRAAQNACLVLMLFTSLGVPLSWHKIQFGPEVSYVGLLLNARKSCLGLMGDEVTRWVAALLALQGCSRLDRRTLESLAGCLQWASAVLPRLRPWLAEFYRCINAPMHAHSRRIRITTDVVKAAKLWALALQGGPLLRHCIAQVLWQGASAADAWAAGDRGGIGGWWRSDINDP